MAVAVGLTALYALLATVFGGEWIYVHPLVDALRAATLAGVVTELLILLTLCALLSVTRSLWVRILFLAVSPWYLMAAILPLWIFLTRIGLLTLPDVLYTIVGILFIILVALVVHIQVADPQSEKLNALLEKIRTPWRVVTAVLFALIGVYLVWLYLKSYMPAVSTGEEHYGIPASSTLLPAVPLLLSAAGLLLNKRWSLICSAVIQFIFLLILLVILLSLVVLRSVMTGQTGSDNVSQTLVYLLPGIYLLTTISMTIWCTKRSIK